MRRAVGLTTFPSRSKTLRLLESLGIDESREEELSRGISDLVNRIQDRAAANGFPMLWPVDLRGEDDQSAAEELTIGACRQGGCREGAKFY